MRKPDAQSAENPPKPRHNLLGSNLRRIAQNQGLSDSEVARRAGLGQRRYANYVAGEREPDVATLLRICEALNTSPNEVMGWRGPNQGGAAPSPSDPGNGRRGAEIVYLPRQRADRGYPVSRLSALLAAAKMDWKTLAAKSRITKSRLKALDAGTALWTQPEIDAVAEALNVGEGDLFEFSSREVALLLSYRSLKEKQKHAFEAFVSTLSPNATSEQDKVRGQR